MEKNFWKKRRVFLTGHTGFKGSWLSLWLQEMGAEIVGFSLPPPTHQNLYDLADVGKKMKSIEGDIRELTAIKKAMREAEPTIVIHLAAQPLVRISYSTPVDTYAVNVMGTVNTLEAIRSTATVKAAVMITTDKCYENKEWMWGYRENEPMGGHDPYSSSKGCAELVISAYRRSYFTDLKSPQIASARAGNVIGGGDFAEDRLIPDFIRALQSHKKLEVRNPDATRPWQYVLEPLAGYLQLAESLVSNSGQRFAEGWNFGPNDQDVWPVKNVLNSILDNWSNPNINLNFGTSSDLHEAQALKLDSSKAKFKLGWSPKMHLEEALKWVVLWYQAFLEGSSVRDITLNQIGQYTARLLDNSVAQKGLI